MPHFCIADVCNVSLLGRIFWMENCFNQGQKKLMNNPFTLGLYRRLCPRADTSLRRWKKDRALPKSQGTSAKYGIFAPALQTQHSSAIFSFWATPNQMQASHKWRPPSAKSSMTVPLKVHAWPALQQAHTYTGRTPDDSDTANSWERRRQLRRRHLQPAYLASCIAKLLHVDKRERSAQIATYIRGTLTDNVHIWLAATC